MIQVRIPETKDAQLEAEWRADVRRWFTENLTGIATTEKTGTVTEFRVINGELVEESGKYWDFQFSDTDVALKFKLVFG